nr:hypothetical protein KXZ65_00200 [Pectobacterium sp. PL152]
MARYEDEQLQIKQSITVLSEKKIQLENEIADQKKKLKKKLIVLIKRYVSKKMNWNNG